jgi:ABC-type enterobactin transport system permease subunit
VIETLGVRWQGLLPDQRRWIVLNGLAVTAVINLVANAVIARVSVGDAATVHLWGVPLIDKPSTIIDTVGTFFFLPFVTCLSCGRAIGIERGRGRVSALGLGDVGAWLGRLPEARLRRAVVLGAVCTAVLSPVAVVALLASGVGDMSRTSFVAYKAVLGVALGAIVTPLIALRAMADPLPEQA